jgi:hypothetical protein
MKSSSSFAIGFCLLLSSANALLNNNRIRRCNDARTIFSSSSSLSMAAFGGIGGGGSKKDEPSKLPRDVKDAISQCRAATQAALQNRVSRMDIEMPVGTKFGVEKSSKKTSKGKSSETTGGPPAKALLDQSDRELARLFVEMFQPVGGDCISVIFQDEDLADLAKDQWKDDYGASASVVAVNRRKIAKKKEKAKGFAAKMAAEVGDTTPGEDPKGPFLLPKGTEVALFVAPGPAELVVIEQICSEVGMGTLVVLLNARLSKITDFGTDEATKLFTEEFEPVFCLSAAPQDVARDCLVFRSYPGDWVLARKPKVGQPKTLLQQSARLTTEECKQAYDELDIGDLEKGMEEALENVAGWFR